MDKWTEEQLEKLDAEGFEKFCKREKKKEKGLPCGSFQLITVKKDDPMEKKLDAVKEGIDSLIEMVKMLPFAPDLETMEFFIKEGTYSQDLSWYGEGKEKPKYAVCVAIKYEAKDQKQEGGGQHEESAQRGAAMPD